MGQTNTNQNLLKINHITPNALFNKRIYEDQEKNPAKKWKMCEIYASNRKDGFTYQAYVREDDPSIVKREKDQEGQTKDEMMIKQEEKGKEKDKKEIKIEATSNFNNNSRSTS